MENFDAQTDVQPGDILRRVINGDNYDAVVAIVTDEKIAIANPDAGRKLTNRNRQAKVQWYKRNSPILAGREVIRSS